MAKRRYTSEDLIHTLREADVLLGQGQTIGQACKAIGVTDHTYFRWRKQYGGLKMTRPSASRSSSSRMPGSSAWWPSSRWTS
jgi:transposase-like protein